MSNTSHTELTTAAVLAALQRHGAPLRIAPERLHALQLNSGFDRDLGLDSLTRMELFSRVEAEFAVHLADSVYAGIETPEDLWRALLSAHATPSSLSVAAPLPSNSVAEVSVPQHAQTWLEVLDWHAERWPQRVHVQFFQDDGHGAVITYGELRRQAQAVAAGLQQRGLAPGQTVALMLPTGSDYFYAFFGVLLAGAVPVPVYPPARPSQLEDHVLRHCAILNNCQAQWLITTPDIQPVARLLQAQVASLQGLTAVAELCAQAGTWHPPRVNSVDLAFLQYTSGSTGIPKGVRLTHANLLANVRAMGTAVGAGPDDVFVSWLPLYHDMGLIGAWLGSLYFAMPLVNFSPLTFLARPSRWLTAIQRHRGTLSAAPNFAYELCLKRLKDDGLSGLDLSSLRWLFNGAEPVNPDTLESFCQRFSRYGLSAQALAPVYGLAENSVGLAFPTPGRGPHFDCIDREQLARHGLAVPTEARDATRLRVPACGRVLAGHALRIVDASGQPLPERQQGELEFRGPSATDGYFRNTEHTAHLLHDGWVRSGDLAYLVDGEIYITGRVKDLIIHAGRNLYPHELESAVGQLPGIRSGCVAVFGSRNAEGHERLVVMAETREDSAERLVELRRAIENLALDLLGLPPDQVVFVPPHSVLKTSSGKIRRSSCRDLYESGAAQAGPRSAARQAWRLRGLAVLAQTRWALQRAGAVLYGVYVWISALPLLIPAMLAVALLPDLGLRWRIAHHLTRAWLRIAGIPLTVEGLAQLPSSTMPHVYVCNHASYSDVVCLLAALPQPVSFVTKAELARVPLLGAWLRRLDVCFVERFDRQRALADAHALVEQARQGRSLFYFPEGTFTANDGLRAFRLGAFQTAVQAGQTIVPLALQGSRTLLRDGHWLPRRSAIHLTIGAPLMLPREADAWSAAQQLHDTARAFIVQNCGEVDGV